MNSNNNLLSRNEIYKRLTAALIEKSPPPPAGWCPAQLDEELWKASPEYEQDAFLRQMDALDTCLFYLVYFARRMPDRVNLSETNGRVSDMCADLADEIGKITFEPESVVNGRNKLKSWLKAILAVRTCQIYTEETERHIAEQDAAKRLSRNADLRIKPSPARQKPKEKWQSALAKTIFEKAGSRGRSEPEPSGQSSLF